MPSTSWTCTELSAYVHSSLSLSFSLSLSLCRNPGFVSGGTLIKHILAASPGRIRQPTAAAAAEAEEMQDLSHGTPPHHDGSGPDNEATMYGDPASAEATVADKAEEAAPASEEEAPSAEAVAPAAEEATPAAEEAAPAPAEGKGSPSL